jgi:hypothetical protein
VEKTILESLVSGVTKTADRPSGAIVTIDAVSVPGIARTFVSCSERVNTCRTAERAATKAIIEPSAETLGPL